MNKIGLIIKREYITRVRNKTFLLSTFLFPLLMIGFIAASTFLSIKSIESQRIAVRDQSGQFKGQFKDSRLVDFEFDEAVTENNYKDRGYSGILLIPSLPASGRDTIRLISEKQLGIGTEDQVRDEIRQAMENKMLMDRGIQRNLLDSIQTESRTAFYAFRSYQVQGKDIQDSNSGLAYGIAFASGMLIYLTLFIYGASVMRGVMEEKTNRIAEVMVSSVKPFQLMLGKIIGIAAVGLTQLLLWIGLLLVLSTLMSVFVSPEAIQQAKEINDSMPGSAANNTVALKVMEVQNALSGVNWWLIVGCFIFYYLGGYLFYSALFAAVGSVVNEDPQEAQSLMLPITMPIILSLIIMMNSINSPNSSLATWASIIPFSSPIVMMGRIPFGVPGTVPWWQLGLSMVLLVIGFLFTTWLSAKIYRTGILLYGKKVTLKELARWAFK